MTAGRGRLILMATNCNCMLWHMALGPDHAPLPLLCMLLPTALLPRRQPFFSAIPVVRRLPHLPFNYVTPLVPS